MPVESHNVSSVSETASVPQVSHVAVRSVRATVGVAAVPRRTVTILATGVALFLVMLVMFVNAAAALGGASVDSEVDPIDELEHTVAKATASADGATNGQLSAATAATTDAVATVTATADSATPVANTPAVGGAAPTAITPAQTAAATIFAAQAVMPPVAAAAGGAGLYYVFQQVVAFFGGRLFGLPLFSRIEKGKILDNEGRELLHELITKSPGIGLMELNQASGLGWGTTVYHLGRLESAGLVVSMKNGQNRHFFLNGAEAGQSKQAIALLKNESAADVAALVCRRPGVTQAEIARTLGIKPPTVTKWVQRLADENLVETLRHGRTKVVQGTPRLVEVFGHLDVQVPAVPPTFAAQHEALSLATLIGAGHRLAPIPA